MSYTSDARGLPFIALRPILATLGIFGTVMLVDGVGLWLGVRLFGQQALTSTPWKVLYLAQTGMLLASLCWMRILGGGNLGDFGFRAPRGYMAVAPLFGIAFGLIMLVADYWSNIATRVPPPHFQLSWQNIVGLLSFDGLWAGTAEEILFRGLLITFLMKRISGRVHIGRFNLHIAGIIVALMFSLAHIGSFRTAPFAMAAAQQIYAFVWAILYAFWFEKSGSLLPSIVAHNAGNFAEDALTFLLVWHWA